MKKNVVQILSPVEHVLKRTGRYVGCTNHISMNMFILNDEGVMSFKETRFVPALIKVIREIIDNSCDEHVRTLGKFAKNIKVECSDDGWISVRDDGRGIPVERLANGMWSPEAAWTLTLAGANFNDEADNVTIGQNGEGASLTCILSKEFQAITSDGANKFRMICKDNLSEKDVDVTPCKDKFTQVRFLPDYSRFDLPLGLDQTHKDIIKSDLSNLAMCYPTVTFWFNDKKVVCKSFEKYVQQFGKPYELYDEGNISMAVLMNDSDDFNFIHYINGANVYEGGNPFNGVVDIVYEGIKDVVAKTKKLKTLKKGDVKNKSTFLLHVRNLPNPRFDNQIKSRCINPATEVKAFLDESKLEKFIKTVAKNDEIIGPIVESFEMKENMKHLKELNGLEKTKKFKCEKFMAPIEKNMYFTLCEGDSAQGGLSAVFGRRSLGYFAMRGVPVNTFEITPKKMLENEEITNIIQLLGLKLSDKDSRECSFQNILVATDADLDGFHITGLLLGFFQKYAKWLFLEDRIKRLRTPMIVLKKGEKIVKFFFNFNEFNKFCETEDVSKYNIGYKKGLGSWKKEDLQQLVKENGFEHFVESLKLCNESEHIMNDWLSKHTSDIRKEMLRKNSFNIFTI